LSKAGLLAYAHGFYYALGKQIGKFGWSVEKKSTKKKRAVRLQAEKSGKVQKAKSQTLRLKKTAVKRKKAGKYGRK
jgi:hypothetical protein